MKQQNGCRQFICLFKKNTIESRQMLEGTQKMKNIKDSVLYIYFFFVLRNEFIFVHLFL